MNSHPEANLRVLIAPDKFKGTLTATEAAAAIARGVERAMPTASVVLLPFADGGEGTVDSAVAAGARRHSTTVRGPLGDLVPADWAQFGETAVIEMAQSSGLHLVEPTPRSALDADTFGVGQLIREALHAGCRRIVVGVGGSATTDGGVGALRALGARFLDSDGHEVRGGGRTLAQIHSIDLDGLDQRLTDATIVLCSDVSNPLAGVGGAAAVFGPQKGADPATVAELDAGLHSFAAALTRRTGVDVLAEDWGGAGGGLAAGLRAVLDAQPANGVDILADVLDLTSHLDDADLVIVGEGCIDAQSILGKTPVGIARHAQARGIRCIAIVGRRELAPDQLQAVGIERIISSSEIAPTTSEALAEPARWVSIAAEHAIRQVQTASTSPRQP